MSVLRMRNEKYRIYPTFMAESPKFLHLTGFGVGEHDGDVRFLIESRNLAVSRMCNKNMQFGQIAKIPSSYTKSESENRMVTTNFSTESRNVGVSRMQNEKVCNLALIYGRIAKLPASYRKLGLGTPQ